MCVCVCVCARVEGEKRLSEIEGEGGVTREQV